MKLISVAALATLLPNAASSLRVVTQPAGYVPQNHCGGSAFSASQNPACVPPSSGRSTTHDEPIVICGPSGVGKGTIIGRLMDQFPGYFCFAVSHTTRSPRPGEKDGVDYFFTDRPDMESAIERGDFIEYAEVCCEPAPCARACACVCMCVCVRVCVCACVCVLSEHMSTNLHTARARARPIHRLTHHPREPKNTTTRAHAHISLSHPRTLSFFPPATLRRQSRTTRSDHHF